MARKKQPDILERIVKEAQFNSGNWWGYDESTFEYRYGRFAPHLVVVPDKEIGRKLVGVLSEAGNYDVVKPISCHGLKPSKLINEVQRIKKASLKSHDEKIAVVLSGLDSFSAEKLYECNNEWSAGNTEGRPAVWAVFLIDKDSKKYQNIDHFRPTDIGILTGSGLRPLYDADYWAPFLKKYLEKKDGYYPLGFFNAGIPLLNTLNVFRYFEHSLEGLKSADTKKEYLEVRNEFYSVLNQNLPSILEGIEKGFLRTEKHLQKKSWEGSHPFEYIKQSELRESLGHLCAILDKEPMHYFERVKGLYQRASLASLE